MVTQQSDHDMLVAIAADMRRLVKAVEGNGQPGLIQVVATIRAELDETNYAVQDIKKQVPSSKEKIAGWTAIGIALITTLGGIATTVFAVK